ncbi:hypothetical protein PAXRUDRAFT_139768 [Paxillus rubicundulus Ve08.2h10]|uniref:Tetraspanin n=1 Tax=Paxillus rubicundulus Ve08.2h10 TaxID=930991 RepID=A0A0D0DZD1_9AGAM|nr:hypothetical protein PAXRUDRAFT_139768 [Paxillus rubicundulus Ve08.2h10]
MVSKRLMLTWCFFDFCLMAAGVTSLVFSVIWREPDLLLKLTFSTTDLTGGTVLGIMLLVTFALSLVLVAQRGKTPLVILNWILLVDGIAILLVGTYVWFYTLHERNNYHTVFGAQSNATKIDIQDTLKCCGYFNATDEVAFGGNFCPNQAAAMTANSVCVTPITQFADRTLNDVFSTIYGFMSTVIGLFLANMCVISKRQEAERFEKIDAKRGGQGFV